MHVFAFTQLHTSIQGAFRDALTSIPRRLYRMAHKKHACQHCRHCSRQISIWGPVFALVRTIAAVVLHELLR